MTNASSPTQDKLELEIEREQKKSEVIFLWNQHPSKNIGQLCEFFKVPETPRSIAHLMHVVPGLLGTKIGDYLSKDGNQEILKCYFNEADLKVSFVPAMRIALSGTMFLPGEAQLIDRVVEVFAQSYCEQNPNTFPNTDIPYTLAFALIMLNSDQHNPNMKKRMSCDQFIENFTGALPTQVISREDLTSFYFQIKENPFKFNGENQAQFMAMSAPRIRGYLKKRTKKVGEFWKRYYFVLTNSCLYYFKDDSPESEQDPLGNIQLIGVEVLEVRKNPCQILLKAIKDPIQYVKFTPIPTLVPNTYQILLQANDPQSTAKWFKWIKKSAIFSCFNTEETYQSSPPREQEKVET